MMCAIHFLELPSNPPTVTEVQCSNTVCTVYWTASDPAQNFIVKWIDLSTNYMMNRSADLGNTNSYSFTKLSINMEYNVSVTAVDVCGRTITSNYFTFNGESGCVYSYCMCVHIKFNKIILHCI